MPKRSTDPLLQQAIELDGFEEGRHKEVLSNLVQAYGIHLAPEPEYRRPRDPEWAFMVTGFSECIDSFFAFGLFALAKRSGLFPAGPGRYIRAGHAGGRSPHPLLRQLGGVAPAQPAALAATDLFGQNRLASGLFSFGNVSASREDSAVPAMGRGEWRPRTTTLP